MVMFIGHTRFSVFDPSSPSWQITQPGRFKSSDEYREYLFSPERLELRTNIFLNYSLPEISKAAESHKIVHIVTYSDSLPEPWQSKLEKAINDHDFLIGDRRSKEKPLVNPHEIASEVLDGNGVYGIYRLDDDDVLSSTFFTNSLKYLKEEFAGMQVSLSDGYTGFWENGFIRNIRKVHWPMLAIGFMNICQVSEGKVLLQPRPAPHHIANRTNIVITDPLQPSYLWLRHVDQDTAYKFNTSQVRHAILRDMEKYESVQLDFSFNESFPAIANSLREYPEYFLVEEALEINGPIPLHFPMEMNWFELAVELDCGTGIGKHNALVSFIIQNSHGDTVNSQIEDLPMSSDSKIKHYRYLRTELGKTISTFEVQLPSNLTCKEIYIQRFINTESSIKVKKARVRKIG